jgi:hypothetical protein
MNTPNCWCFRILFGMITTTKCLRFPDLFFSKPGQEHCVGSFDTWVTIAPVMRRFISDLLESGATRQVTDVRIAQRLGLPLSTIEKVFVEMWVDPAHIYRPCIDAEVTDSLCVHPHLLEDDHCTAQFHR